MNNSYDVAVLGVGAAGSAAVYHLAKTGKKIPAIDKYNPPHNLGSSHGQSRIIREAYFESPVYVPLVQQAYKLWYQLEKESDKRLLLKTGGLMFGMPGSSVVQGALRSAVEHGLPYEYLDNPTIKKRYPWFNPTADTVALFEENAGILFPEECIRANIELAKNTKVSFHFNEIVTGITVNDDEVEIATDKGKYTAEKVIVSVGSWLGELFPELQLPLSVARQVLFWFKCDDKNIKKILPESFPIYIWEYKKDKIFYGFPDLGDGIKIAIHHEGKLTVPDEIDRQVKDEEIAEMANIIQQYFNIRASYNYSAVCMYTNTPDQDFIIDYHPLYNNIIIASPCSGHGFKFSSAVGKILADMATERPLSFDISIFNIARFPSDNS